jgi:signal transduction histidine kinase
MKIPFQDSASYPFRRTWSDESATGYITNKDGDRYWNVVKGIDRDDGSRVGLVLFQLSLRDHDAFVRNALRQVYVVAFISLIFVLGLIGIHVRLYGFAIKATKLEEVDRMKDDFISMASHELRSPLTVLRGYIDILKTGFLQKIPEHEFEAERTYLNHMEESVSRLNTLVESAASTRQPYQRLATDGACASSRWFRSTNTDGLSFLRAMRNASSCAKRPSGNGQCEKN